MAQTIRCPKCKTEQPKQPICSHCGFDIRAFALEMQRRKQAAASPEQGPSTITCPKCNKEQPKQPICSHCGFDIRAYSLGQKKEQPEPQSPQPQKAGEMITCPNCGTQQRKEGICPECGYDNRLHEEKYAIRTPVAAQPEEEAPPQPELFSIGKLFSESWEVYKQRIGTLIVLYILSIVFWVLPALLFGGVGALSAAAMPKYNTYIALGGLLLASIGSLAGLCWGLAALTAGVIDSSASIGESLGRGWRMLWSYAWVVSLALLVILGGFSLLFIPGIIFLVWAFPGQFVIFTSDERGMKALLKGREYIRGYFFDSFIKLLIISLCMTAVSLIPLGGIIFFPFMVIYLYKMYQNLRGLKGSVITYSPSAGAKLAWFGMGALGLAAPIVLFALLGMPMLQQSFPSLTATAVQEMIEAETLTQTQKPSIPLFGADADVKVSTNKQTYLPNEPIKVVFSGLPAKPTNWINIVKKSDSDRSRGEWTFINKESGELTFKGQPPGIYEVRVYFDWPEGRYNVRARYSFTVD